MRLLSKRLLFTCITTGLTLFTALFTPHALADRLESDSFVIQFGNFNVTSGEKSSASYNLTDTTGQTAAGPFGEYGSSSYFIGSGFQYIYQIDTFSFTISDLSLDLGELTPNTHNTAAHTLEISTRGPGYTVYAYEQEPLTLRGGSATIPDTTCDAGGCDETSAGEWTNQSIPGFGFNISGAGTSIPSDFVSSDYFRQFADRSSSEDMQAILSSDETVKNETTTVTMKAGISGNQAAGTYQTEVVYVAVPLY